jgi:hypothetical protein
VSLPLSLYFILQQNRRDQISSRSVGPEGHVDHEENGRVRVPLSFDIALISMVELFFFNN